MERRSYALLVAYHGGPYKGWQPHPLLPTVGGVLIGALRRAQVHATPFGASRTDAGVHARAQVVSFSSKTALVPEQLRSALNADLPSTLRVLSARVAPKSFHAHWSSVGKIYRYRISFCSEPEAWRLPSPRYPYRSLDPVRLEQALALLLDHGDLRALCLPGERGPRPRPLERARLIEHSARGSTLEFRAKGFGKYMIRHLVCAALGMAVGALEEQDLQSMLRGQAGRPPRAEADGLCLHRVLYPAELDPFPDADSLVG
jgi:tRNA pseudouridine38-40 synthase